MKPDPDKKAWLDAEAAWLDPEAEAIDDERAEIRTAKDALDKAKATIRKNEADAKEFREQLDTEYAEVQAEKARINDTDAAEVRAWTAMAQLYLDRCAVWQVICEVTNENWAANNRDMDALLARCEALTAREEAWKERCAAYAARRDAYHAQRDKALTDEGLMFELMFDGHHVVVANTIKGACFQTSEIADILGCGPTDLARVPGIFLDDVLTKSMRYGPRGAQLRKWLKRVIRPSKERIRPEIIEQGLLIYDLTPVLSPDGSILRLTEQVMITPEGQAAEERDGAVLH
jgi:hypothetical protein